MHTKGRSQSSDDASIIQGPSIRPHRLARSHLRRCRPGRRCFGQRGRLLWWACTTVLGPTSVVVRPGVVCALSCHGVSGLAGLAEAWLRRSIHGATPVHSSTSGELALDLAFLQVASWRCRVRRDYCPVAADRCHCLSLLASPSACRTYAGALSRVGKLRDGAYVIHVATQSHSPSLTVPRRRSATAAILSLGTVLRCFN